MVWNDVEKAIVLYFLGISNWKIANHCTVEGRRSGPIYRGEREKEKLLSELRVSGYDGGGWLVGKVE